jgi:hypothetical protein
MPHPFHSIANGSSGCAADAMYRASEDASDGMRLERLLISAL